MLVGFDYTLHGEEWTSAMTPIYKTEAGLHTGQPHGNNVYGGKPGKPARVIADDGSPWAETLVKVAVMRRWNDAVDPVDAQSRFFAIPSKSTDETVSTFRRFRYP